MTSTETDPNRAARVDGPLAVHTRGLPEIEAGRYEFLDEIARGGMGRILRARDRLGRIVAVKRLLAGLPNHVALFEREVRIIARLSHPSIVSVIEAGILPDGERIYVMRLVPGRALRDVLHEDRPVKERLGHLPIAIAIADALAYAHAQGVIHRDLKPSNVLIGEFGEVVVIDWGLAHDDADEDAAERVMGTPAYMAPEAARGEAADERADVYAIGAILYETLAGAPPYRGEDGAAIMAAVRAGPPEPIAQRAPGTPADLAAIVDKAMARERSRRYPSAKELADELRRFATGQLVSAHEYSLRDRVLRFVRRNRAIVTVSAAALATVIVLTAIGVTRIVHERDVAQDRADRLTLAHARLELDRDPAAALATLDALPAKSSSWTAARTIAADAVARGVPRHVRLGGVVAALALVDGRPRALVQHDDALEVIDVGGESRRIATASSVVAMSADGSTIAAVDDGQVRVWRAGVLSVEVAGPRLAPIVAVSHDGAIVAAAGRDFGLASWRGSDVVARDVAARDVAQLAIEGDIVLAVDAKGRLASTETAVSAIATHAGRAIAATSRGDLYFVQPQRPPIELGFAATMIGLSRDRIVAIGDGVIAVLDRDGTRLRTIGTTHRPRAVAIDDRGLVAISERNDIWWWDPDDPSLVRIAGATAPAVAVAASGNRIVAAAEDGSVWAWTGDTATRLGAHVGAARALALGADFVVTTGDDRAVRRWSFDGTARLVGVHHGPGLALAIAPDGAIASGGVDRLVRVWRGENATVLGRHDGPIRALAFSADGKRLASLADDRVAMVWPIGGGAPRRLEHPAPVTAIAWAGEALVTGARDGAVRFWAGGEARVLATHAGAVRSVAVAGARIASAGDDGHVGIGDATLLALYPGHGDFVRRVAIAPDGRTIASASEDGSVRLWDVATGESRAVRIGGWVADVAFLPDGRRVAATGADGALWIVRDDLPHERGALRALIADRARAAR